YAEEDAFRRTLATGTQIFDLAVADAKSQHQTVLSSERAFQLHDTYGFPIDLTREGAAGGAPRAADGAGTFPRGGGAAGGRPGTDPRAWLAALPRRTAAADRRP